MEKIIKKYYWLKMEVDFFEHEEIKLIESMPKGRDYIVFYMKLLLKGANTDGRLMFKDIIPYTDEMLASITNTDVDTVRTAVKLFIQLGMMEKLDDGALFMLAVENMVGSETEYARKKREYREKEKERKKLEQLGYKANIEKIENKNEEDTFETDLDILEDIFKNEKDNFLKNIDNSETKKDNVRQEKELEKEKDIDTTTKIDILNKKEENDSSSILIKNLLYSHGITEGTISNILTLAENNNISLDRVAAVLKAAPFKKWKEGAIYQALRDNWSTEIKNSSERLEQKQKSLKIDRDIQTEREKNEELKKKVEKERAEKTELLEFFNTLSDDIKDSLKARAMALAKKKYGVVWKSMCNTSVIYEVIREYKQSGSDKNVC